MVSVKTAALGTAVLAFCGWGIQLGSLAALNHIDCENKVALDEYTISGRRMLATPNEAELKARCSFSYAMSWCAPPPTASDFSICGLSK
jgi:hypothetical protein